MHPTLLTVPITKIDQDTWTVSGVVTAEVLDKQGDIVDYVAAKPFFQHADLWPGNIREMHDPSKAVGKRIAVEFDDANKVITLNARVSKGAPDTWAKCQDGTLSMFSIGGDGERKPETVDGKLRKRVFLKQLAEVSLVDNGACPVAKFEIAKRADDGTMTDPQPADPDAADQTLDVLDKAAKKGPAAGEDASEHNKTATGQVGAYYAGTDGKSFPIKTPQDVKNAARALGRTKQDRGKVKANIIDAAKKLGDAHVRALPDAWKEKDDEKKAAGMQAGNVSKFQQRLRAGLVAKGMIETWDIDSALAAIGHLQRLVASEYWEARQAAITDGNADGVEVSQVKMLKQATDLVLEFLQSEWDEQFADDSEATPTQPVPLGIITDDSVVEMFAQSLGIIKAGARHSKKDQALVQKVHDVANDLGATCGPMDKGMELGTVRKALESTTAELAATKATASKQDETIARLEKRIDTLERLPQPGGPKKAALAPDKTTGARAEGEGESVDDLVEKIEKISRVGTPEQREAVALAMVKAQRSTGVGQINMTPSRGQRT